jgi:hypothetical protein
VEVAEQTCTQGVGQVELFRVLLQELRAAHEQLLQAMAQMDAVTTGLGDRHQYIHARFAVSRASLARRMLWNRIFRTITPLVSQADAARLFELQSVDVALLHCSSLHVGRWTTHEVADCWLEYCQASRGIRSKMAVAIANEQRQLYPLLQRYVRQAPQRRCA